MPTNNLFSYAPLTTAEALAAADETKALAIGSNNLSQTPAFFADQFPRQAAAIVADTTTWRVAGSAVHDALKAAGIPQQPPFIFDDPNLYGEYSYIEKLRDALAAHNATPIAVGSGVINDLTKRAAAELKRPYLCVATAASMDGYTAYGSSITYHGAKQTLAGPAPQALLADIEIVRHAPPEMTASGYADLIAKIPAGADWIIADSLGVEPISEKPWRIVQGGLRTALAEPAAARAGQPAALSALMEGLLLGGFAMQASKTSRPASGTEHQFSHLWNMEHHTHNGSTPSHGNQVGIGTLASTALYEFVLQQNPDALDLNALAAAWPSADAVAATVANTFKGTDFADAAVKETLAKHPTPDQLRDQLHLLRAQWPSLAANLRRQLLPFNEVKRRLIAVGAPSEPEQIGITRNRLRDSFLRAYYIRRRYTILDLAVRTGWLTPALDHLFSPAGPWPINT